MTAALKTTLSLCRPRADLACFRCCPPIRPAGYDHLRVRAALTRELEKNTRAFDRGERGSEIEGRTCWGLGFLDDGRKLVGCLLHPARNQGDLRELTGYREKCARELCPQAVTYGRLDEEVGEMLLTKAAGGDSFTFSSPEANPLWRLLEWGPDLLNRFGAMLLGAPASAAYLETRPAPRTRAWLLKRLLEEMDQDRFSDLITSPSFWGRFEQAAEELMTSARPPLSSPLANEPFVHRLGLDPDLADLIRLGLGCQKMTRARLDEVRAKLEAGLGRVVEGLSHLNEAG